MKIDESDRSAGWKFSEYEMKGIPLRVEVGPRDLANGVVTIAKRNDGVKEQVKIEDVSKRLLELIPVVHKEMYDHAYQYLLEHTSEVRNMEELNDRLAKGGYAKMMWCGEQACEDKIKELTNATARCMPFNQTPFDDVCPICGKKAKKVVLFAKAY